jgi:uncharacterized protein DUF2516
VLAPIAGIFLLIYFATLALSLWALVDAAIRPQRAFVAAEKQTKAFWIAILVVAALAAYIRLFTFVAIIAALVYLLDVRPAVRSYK